MGRILNNGDGPFFLSVSLPLEQEWDFTSSVKYFVASKVQNLQGARKMKMFANIKELTFIIKDYTVYMDLVSWRKDNLILWKSIPKIFLDSKSISEFFSMKEVLKQFGDENEN